MQTDSGADCGITLTLKTLTAYKGQIFCKPHAPRPKKTDVVDDVLLNSSKKAQLLKHRCREERSHNPAAGYMHKPTAVIDDIATITAKKAQEIKSDSVEGRFAPFSPRSRSRKQQLRHVLQN